MLRKIDKKGRGKDIASSGRIYLCSSISRELPGYSIFKKSRTVAPISGDQQRNTSAPIGQQSISSSSLSISKRQEIIMAKNQHIQQRKKLFSALPGSRPDATIRIPTTQPALGSCSEQRTWLARQISHKRR